MKKYYFINYRINIKNSTPYYGRDLTDKTPFEYAMYHKDLGGDYQNRCILFSQEITEAEYNKYKDLIDDE
jgi:hypothetical protein